MADDVLINKAAAIERAVQRVRAGIIDEALTDRLKKMVGFRNVAVHDYHRLSIDIVRQIILRHLDNFLAFARVLLGAR